MPDFSPARSAAGRLLFESKKLSLSEEIACKTCHLDRFGSADGIPNAIGTGGRGEGRERLAHGGDILPRNTLPLWGRGSKGFNVLFWDGRVDKSDGRTVRSQFGADPPSNDPLVVAAHLPMVEIREMVPDTPDSNRFKTETIGSAREVYAMLERRIRSDKALSSALADAYRIGPAEITIKHVAESLADFFRDRFRLRETRLHRFVFAEGALSSSELKGGLLFYGKARCFACHNGPFFSDLQFHAIPFGQLGFGRNGFGIDYGRFNVTLDPADRHKFRTPPLFNVARTAPYSHSGATYSLAAAIRAHVDPLAVADVPSMTGPQRVEFYNRMAAWTREPVHQVYLSDEEIADIVSFLATLSFDPAD
jgi:cytochrome c peroxidase